MKKKVLAVIFVIFIVIGIIHSLVVFFSLNIFLTWIFIGLWIIITLKIFENIKRHREFNSPHNTAFFVIIPLFNGFFYSIWGSFTGILGENLLGGSNLYFSLWSLIFGLPYVIYGSYSLHRCYKKYNVIYFGTKSVKAKLFGTFLTLFVIISIILYWIIFYTVIEFYNTPLVPLRFSLDLNLLLLLIASLTIFILFGVIFPRRSLPALTSDYINQRTRRINSLSNPRPSNSQSQRNRRQRSRTTTRSTQSPSNRTITRTTNSRSNSSRNTPTSYTQRTRKKTTKTVRTSTVKRSSKPSSKAKSSGIVRNINQYKPKGASISSEDFKCIFCFKLPKLPDDNGRGIILCPNCKYPAHADEFRDWLRASNLCSRCSAPIPSRFKNNPKIISVKNYMVVYRYYLKKKK